MTSQDNQVLVDALEAIVRLASTGARATIIDEDMKQGVAEIILSRNEEWAEKTNEDKDLSLIDGVVQIIRDKTCGADDNLELSVATPYDGVLEIAVERLGAPSGLKSVRVTILDKARLQ